jgi:PAS domain S-box-containing protein
LGQFDGKREQDGERARDAALGRYELILQSMTEGVSLSSEDGTIVYTNPAEDRMFGYRPGELIGQHVSVQNAYSPEENRRRVEGVIAQLKSHGSWEGEWLNRRKDGSSFVTASRITAVDVEERAHWLCVQRDVTEERAAETRFRQLADLVPSFVWFASPDGSINFLNDRWYAYTGQTPEVALPDGWTSVIHPDDRQHVAGRWAEARAEQVPYAVECRYRSAGGSYRWYVARAEPVRDESGAVTAWFGTSTDIHDRKQIEERLLESAQRLDLAVTAHGIGIFDWHIPSGHVIWTEQEEQVFGLAPRSFGGHISNWAEHVLPEDAEAMNADMAMAMAERRESYDFAFRIRRPDGEVRWIEGSSRFIYREDGTPERMVGTNIDATDRRRAEEHQRLLVNELNHRVKNTLAIVQGIAQQSFKGVEGAAAAKSAFEGRLAALSAAHNLLTRENWESASIANVIAESMAPYAGGGRVEMIGPELKLMPKTAVSLALAVHELGTNAAKYGALSNGHGRVAIRWRSTGDRLSLVWQEVGGPPVSPPTKRGFGTRMIERSLASELDGEVSIRFEPGGLVCTVDARLPGEPG